VDDHNEIGRARERLHKIESTCLAIEFRLKAIEHKLIVIEPKVDQLARADEIAEAVKQRIGSDRRVRFTRFQRLAAYLGALVIALDPALRVWSHFRH
jgi:septal ring factor EnvC (AmiA/AmiB activator)